MKTSDKLSLVAGLCITAFWLVSSTAAAQGQNEAASRFLFVVETSRAMKPRANEVNKSIAQLLLGYANGRMQRGDTYSIWTFNETLRAGAFPLQRCSPGATFPMTQQAADFLTKLKYEKKGTFEALWPTLSRLISESGSLTVILYSTGEQPISGTPYDEPINNIFAQHRADLAKSKIPFVLVFSVREGKLAGFTLNSTTGPVNIPDNRPPPKVVERKIETPPAPVKFAPPLILRGKKEPEFPPISEPATKPQEEAPPQRVPQPVIPAPQAAAPVPPAEISVPATVTTESAPAQPEQSAAVASPETATPVVETPRAAISDTSKSPGESKPSVEAAPVTASREIPATSPEPAPKKISSPEPSVAAAAPPPVVETKIESPVTTPPKQMSPQPSLPAPAPTSVAVATPRFTAATVWVAVAVVGCAAGVLVFLLFRSRPPSRHGSLITESLERHRRD